MSVSTRRGRRQQQKGRRPRPAPSHGRGRRGANRLWIGRGIVGGLVVLFLAARQLGVIETGTAGLDVRDPKYDPAGQPIGQKLPDESSTHVPAGQKVGYGNIPPASGPHWGQPQAPAPWGIKDTKLPDEVTVHNLEHGGIVISYNGLAAAEVDELVRITRALTSGGFSKIILQPYPEMADAKVAVTAWVWQLKLQGVDDVQIVKFVRLHYESPEAPEPRVR
ncbi:MAG: DUF3105 domain-containing protein [Chloroflexota bacterium]|mgnify:CR=1 FL=1